MCSYVGFSVSAVSQFYIIAVSQFVPLSFQSSVDLTFLQQSPALVPADIVIFSVGLGLALQPFFQFCSRTDASPGLCAGQ